MQPRARGTYKILAVALTAAAGCGNAVRPDATAEPTAGPGGQRAPVTGADDRAPTEAVNTAGAPAITTNAPSAPAPLPERPTSDSPALLALSGELVDGGRERALSRVAYFRPLCDADGYPLVGNVVLGKGESGKYQPSAFCAEIRGQRKK